MSVRAWCRENEISEKTYDYWQRRVWNTVQETVSAEFAELRLSQAPTEPEMIAKIRIGSAEAEIYNAANAAIVEAICRALMQEIGKGVRRTLVMIPAQVRIREDRYYTYACQNCKDTAKQTPILQTPKDKPVISGSFASPEAVAHLMTQKFVMGSPLYRQGQEPNRGGVQLSGQTMSNWILKASRDWRRFLQGFSGYLHADGCQGVSLPAGVCHCGGLLGSCPAQV